jgi:hypothetical protein
VCCIVSRRAMQLRRSGDDVLRRTLCRVLPVWCIYCRFSLHSRLFGRAHPVAAFLSLSLRRRALLSVAGARACTRSRVHRPNNTHRSYLGRCFCPGFSRFPASRKSITALYSLSGSSLVGIEICLVLICVHSNGRTSGCNFAVC